MNASTQRTKLGNPGRWRAWARAIAGGRPTPRPGLTRRRAPLAMALLRRARAAFWIAQRNLLTRHFAHGDAITVRPRLHFALHWSSPLSTVLRTSSTTGAPSASSQRVVMGMATQLAGRNAPQHRCTTLEQRLEARSLMREIVERTRRIEDRMRFERPLALRSVPQPSAATQKQEALRRSGPDWWKTELPATMSRPAPAPAVNIDQIADTVMRRIDQRMVAWRERMGRT